MICSVIINFTVHLLAVLNLRAQIANLVFLKMLKGKFSMFRNVFIYFFLRVRRDENHSQFCAITTELESGYLTYLSIKPWSREKHLANIHIRKRQSQLNRFWQIFWWHGDQTTIASLDLVALVSNSSFLSFFLFSEYSPLAFFSLKVLLKGGVGGTLACSLASDSEDIFEPLAPVCKQFFFHRAVCTLTKVK